MKKHEVKITELTLKDAKILPPPQGTCPVCAVKHEPDMPHNKDSLYYQYKFYQEQDRWPTWEDAIEHCPEEIKKSWMIALNAVLEERGC